MAAVYRNLYAAFPDYRWELHTLFAEADWVAAKATMTGTHLGKPDLPVFGGLMHDTEPTGKPVSVINFHLYRMEDGLIAEHSAARDDLGMVQQMGLLPATNHPAGDTPRPS